MPTTPQDRKPKAEHTEPATFTATNANGETVTYTLPERKAITSGMLRRHRTKDPQDYVYSLLEDTCDAETLAALDSLDIDEVDKVLGEWGDHVFGTNPGN